MTISKGRVAMMFLVFFLALAVAFLWGQLSKDDAKLDVSSSNSAEPLPAEGVAELTVQNGDKRVEITTDRNARNQERARGTGVAGGGVTATDGAGDRISVDPANGGTTITGTEQGRQAGTLDVDGGEIRATGRDGDQLEIDTSGAGGVTFNY